MSLTHAKVSAIEDGADSDLVQPSDWNAEHLISDFIQALNGQTPIALVGPFINGVGLLNSYMQTAWQNKSNGTNASTDLVLSADNATDSTFYFDMGINGSGFAVGTWTINGAGDAYIYNQSAGLAIGCAAAGKKFRIFTGGTLAANARLDITDTDITPLVPILVPTAQGIGIASGAPSVTTGKLYVANSALQYNGAPVHASRVNGTTSSATPAPNCDTTDLYTLTALAAAAAFAAPTGTPYNGQKLMIRIKSDASPRGLSWNAAYVAGGVPLPTTTVANKITTIGFMYNTDNSLNKWCCIAVAQEA